MHTKFLVVLFCTLLFSSCTSIIRTNEASDSVRINFLNYVVDKSTIESFQKSCALQGEVIGSEGHWYTYWFVSNTNLTQGAINDMKNRAHEMGANTIIVYKNIDFSTSVTLLGQAYACSYQPELSKSRF